MSRKYLRTHKISMKSVASWIPTRQNEGLCPLSMLKLIHWIKCLIENPGQTNRMSWGTIATIEIGLVCHVRAVIGWVQCFVVPAHGKEDLHSKAVLTKVSISCLKSVGLRRARHSWICQAVSRNINRKQNQIVFLAQEQTNETKSLTEWRQSYDF
jgi:hypothetical protein